jgi:DNA-binding MarR family transcriptional regulator
MKQNEITLILVDRDLEDAKRILALVTRAGERRRITTGAREFDVRRSELEDHDAREKLALQMLAAREARDELLPDSLSTGPAWDILLVLYLADRAGVRHSISRIMELSRTAVTTGLRYAEILEAEGLVKREKDKRDGRVSNLLLEERARDVVDKILSAALAD